MLTSFSIGTSGQVENVKAKLDQEFNLLQNDGIKVTCDQENKGNFTFLEYNIADYGDCGYSEDDTRNILKHYVANAVSDIILTDWERNLLEEVIKENYYYFTKEEQRAICDLGLRHLGNNTDEDSVADQLNRKSLILRRLLEYLHNNSDIVIEGFIRFRLREYMEELAKIAERAADDYILEKEYKEFVRLLKYFVDIQEPRLEMVQVLVQSSGMFKLLDVANRNINSEYLDGFIVELGDSELNYEDLLISALITIAPSRILLHCKENDKVLTSLDTILGVFGERVRYCDGCELCQKSETGVQEKK